MEQTTILVGLLLSHTLASALLTNGDTMTCTETNCVIQCDTERACFRKTIDATQSDTLTLICSGATSCQYLEMVSSAHISTDIHCTGPNSCDFTTFDVANSASVVINCNATEPDGQCQNTKVNATKSTTLNISCHGNKGCLEFDVYCPLSANGECNIECEVSEGMQSCSRMNIFTPSADSLDIQCGTLSRLTCSETNIYCGSDESFPHSSLQYSLDDQSWGCSEDETDQCCPLYDGTLNLTYTYHGYNHHFIWSMVGGIVCVCLIVSCCMVYKCTNFCIETNIKNVFPKETNDKPKGNTEGREDEEAMHKNVVNVQGKKAKKFKYVHMNSVSVAIESTNANNNPTA